MAGSPTPKARPAPMSCWRASAAAPSPGASFSASVWVESTPYSRMKICFGAWPGTPDYQPQWLKGSAIRADVTPEYLGVGYIIGPRIAGLLFAGGVFSWLVLMPAIYFFGSHFPAGDLSRDQADRADVSQRSLGFLHPPHGRRRGRSVRADHADQDHADDLWRLARGCLGNLRQSGGSEERPAAHRRRSALQRGGRRIAWFWC